MQISRILLACAATLALTVGLAGSALADNYPSRTVRIINPFPAGGGLDVLIRPIAQKLSESLGQSFVVENRPGGNGAIGTLAASHAAPDGYTLLAVTTGALAMKAAVNPNLPYDPVKAFAPISNFADSAYIIAVHPSLNVNSVKELIALAKAKPDTIMYGSSGVGSAQHFAAEIFSQRAGIKLTHVPYRGSAPANNDLIAGHIGSMFDSLQAQTPMIQAGQVKALGLMGPQRSQALPEVPTVAEAGVADAFAGSWYGIVAPANTPRAIIDKLNAEVKKAIAAKDMQARFDTVGTQAVGNSPDEFAAQIRDDVKKFRDIAQKVNIKVEQ